MLRRFQAYMRGSSQHEEHQFQDANLFSEKGSGHQQKAVFRGHVKRPQGSQPSGSKRFQRRRDIGKRHSKRSGALFY